MALLQIIIRKQSLMHLQ